MPLMAKSPEAHTADVIPDIGKAGAIPLCCQGREDVK